MGRPRFRRAVALVAALSVSGVVSVAAQATSPQGPGSTPSDPAAPQVVVGTPQARAADVTSPDATVNLERIKSVLSHDPALKIDQNKLMFYIQVVAKFPTFREFIGDYDLMKGATRGGNPMTHAEFVNMVTPRDLYGSGGIQATEMLQFALVNWLGHMLAKKVADSISNSRDEAQIRQIREQIDRELAALRAKSDKDKNDKDKDK
jgi:hypothetical protein